MQKFATELSKDQIPRGAEYLQFLLKSISFRIRAGRELEGKRSVVIGVWKTPQRGLRNYAVSEEVGICVIPHIYRTARKGCAVWKLAMAF